MRASAGEALARAATGFRALALEGGYGWRVSADRTEQAGEVAMSATQIWVPPPGTPAVGMAFLRAYEVRGDEAHLLAARDAADALVFGQLESGGWDYLVEFDPAKRSAWKYRLDRNGEAVANASDAKNISTYDDDNTQSVLRFLMAFVAVAGKSLDPSDALIPNALECGLEKLLEAQCPNGAWPQRWDGGVTSANKHNGSREDHPFRCISRNWR